MTKTKQITIIIITAVVFFILGCVISRGINQGVIGENTFQAGWDTAEKRLVESGFVPMLGEGMEIKSVNGVIEKIEGNKITLKIQPLSPLADPKLDIRIIDISGAKLYQLIERDQDEFQKEMEIFNEKMQEQMDNSEEVIELISSPEFFLKQEINLDEIKVGQQIMVTAKEDIKEIKQFEVIEVEVSFMPVISQMMEEELDTLPITETEM